MKMVPAATPFTETDDVLVNPLPLIVTVVSPAPALMDDGLIEPITGAVISV